MQLLMLVLIRCNEERFTPKIVPLPISVAYYKSSNISSFCLLFIRVNKGVLQILEHVLLEKNNVASGKK